MSRMVGEWMQRMLMKDPPGQASAPRLPGFNPHPPGVMQADGASYLLLRLFVAHPTTWFTQGELRKRSKRTRQSVSWALQFLQTRQVITVTDDARNPRYRRYRLAVDLPAVMPATSVPLSTDEESDAAQVPLDLKY